MTDTSHPELVYIDDILGEDGWKAVTHEDGLVLALADLFENLSNTFRLAFHGSSLRPFGGCFTLPRHLAGSSQQ